MIIYRLINILFLQLLLQLLLPDSRNYWRILLQRELLRSVKYSLSILTFSENEKKKETDYFPSSATKKKKSLRKQHVLFGVIKISEQR